MPVLSPDGSHVLSGVGDGRIYLDGVVPPGLENLHAGGWAWQDADVIVGNASLDNVTWGLWQYRISTRALSHVDARGASATYGGGGAWVSYLASRPPVSYASNGQVWTDRVAKGCSPSGTMLFSSFEGDVLYWGNTQVNVSMATCQIGDGDTVLWAETNGRLMASGAPSPLAPKSGGRGARFTQERWLCQWDSGLDALVVYPWQTTGPLSGYVLSRDAKDFNHDIGTRPDGMVVVATGVNQGETSIRYYELDIPSKRFRVNRGDWVPLVLVDMDAHQPPSDDPTVPPSSPIVTFPNYKPISQASYGRRGYCGPYFATDVRIKPSDFATPGNMEMISNGTVLKGNQQVDRPVFVSLSCSGNNDIHKMLGFMAGANDDSQGNAGIKACHQWRIAHGMTSRIVRYYDDAPMPQDFINACERDAIVQVQCYPKTGETVDQAMTRFIESVDRVVASGRLFGIARAFNTKYGGLPLVLGVQDPLCKMIRTRPAGILDAWFSHGRWYEGVESGAAFCAELLAWEPILGGLFTSLP